ncbi:MAG: hypothetical protein WBG62_09495, partial [Cyclobacteriaceae bacterium]
VSIGLSRLNLWIMNSKGLFCLFLITFFAFLSLDCQACCLQDDQDTVFIYLDPAVAKVHEIGRSRYYKPDLSYPKDIRRIYFIHTYSHEEAIGDSVRVSSGEVLLSTTPIIDGPDFFYESPEEFYKRDYLDQSWFEQASSNEIVERLEDKIIFVVDPKYLYEGKFYVVRVHFSSSIP